jgi:His-Xaa-Ser system radical SAM maturase HxsB
VKVLPVKFYQHPRQGGYKLLPFRFARIPGLTDEILITSEVGEYLFLSEVDFQALVSYTLAPEHPAYRDLVARHFLYEEGSAPHLEMIAAQYRTKKAFLRGGPGLHLFVVTLRCDHTCLYCQVSRQSPLKTRFDMSERHATLAVDRLFESPSDTLTIEFQGGEPLLVFDQIRGIIDDIVERNCTQKRSLQFVVASTLHFLTDDMLHYFKAHNVKLSTSLDGPEWLHNANRPNRHKDSFQRTLAGIQKAREVLGDEAIAALPTITRASLPHPEALIDTYVAQGFHSIFLRPISPYGFAVKTARSIGYAMEEFLTFYRRALSYLIALNKHGTTIDEAYTALLLTYILTPFPSSHVDLRSPTGAGLGVLVYNYDGRVYASDESRMLAEMGDKRFCLGTVEAPYKALMQSEAMQVLLAAGIAESLPGCADCAFLPYCGADPVYALAAQDDPVGHRPTSTFCTKQTGIFRILFRLLHDRNPDVLRVFLGWITRQAPQAIVHPGFAG